MLDFGNPTSNLIFVLEKEKASADSEAILVWILMRLSLTPHDAFICYDLATANNLRDASVRKGKRLPSLVTMGKKLANKFIQTSYIWQPLSASIATHSLQYALVNPAECYRYSRAIQIACDKAKIATKLNLEIKVPRFYND